MTTSSAKSWRTLWYFVPIASILNVAVFVLSPLLFSPDGTFPAIPEKIATRVELLQSDHDLTARSHILSFYLTFISLGVGALCLGIGYHVEFVSKGRRIGYVLKDVSKLFLGLLFFAAIGWLLLYQGSPTVHLDYSTGYIFMYPAQPFLLALCVTLVTPGAVQIFAAIFEISMKR